MVTVAMLRHKWRLLLQSERRLYAKALSRVHGEQDEQRDAESH